MKLLVSADLHLGRRSSRVPEDLDGPRFSCARAWLRMVDLALREGVGAVLLAGDLIDRANRFFEAYGPLEKGLTQLSRAGIRTLAVAGNHDHDSLREFRAAREDLGLTLLGADSGWSDHLLELDGERLQILGWSFSTEHHPKSPPALELEPTEPGLPCLGLIHADLDATASRYAPVSRSELAETGIPAWVVGHLHKPDLDSAGPGPLVLVPGSPQAMDPGEAGPHGPWLMEIDQGRFKEPVLLPLSTMRYQEIRVDLDGQDQEEELKLGLIRAVQEEKSRVETDFDQPELLSCRLTLTGRTALHGRLEGLVSGLAESLELDADPPRTVVDKVRIRTRPALDLEALSGSTGLTGILAELILDLEQGRPSPEQSGLIRSAVDRLSQIHSSGPYLNLDPGVHPEEDGAREIIIGQALLLLEELLEQKG